MDKLIEGLIERAKENLKKDGYLAPVIIAMKGDKLLAPILLQFKCDNEKYATYKIIGKIAKKLAADRIILINDVALKMYDTKDSEHVMKNYNTMSPLTYPENMRQDGIFIHDLNLITEKVKPYFLRYKKQKKGSFKFYNINTFQGSEDSFSGEIMNSVLKGFKNKLL